MRDERLRVSQDAAVLFRPFYFNHRHRNCLVLWLFALGWRSR